MSRQCGSRATRQNIEAFIQARTHAFHSQQRHAGRGQLER
jgi:hypothetical protein